MTSALKQSHISGVNNWATTVSWQSWCHNVVKIYESNYVRTITIQKYHAHKSVTNENLTRKKKQMRIWAKKKILTINCKVWYSSSNWLQVINYFNNTCWRPFRDPKIKKMQIACSIFFIPLLFIIRLETAWSCSHIKQFIFLTVLPIHIDKIFHDVANRQKWLCHNHIRCKTKEIAMQTTCLYQSI